MKVLFVWDSDYPWDIRVSKICNSLVENGDEVHLVCRNQQRRPMYEQYEGIQLHRLFCLPRFFGKLNNIFGFPLFFSPIWLSRIHSVTKRYNAEVIIVRDLPMAIAALMIGKIRGNPVVLDMAECYPELIRLIWKFEPFKLVNILIRNPLLADIVERIVINNIDHIWVMIEESRNRLLDKGISKDKISIVSNTPVRERFNGKSSYLPEIIQQHQEALILLYVGFVNYSRGLDVIIESLPHVIRQGIDVFCIIIGTGTAEKALADKVQQLDIQDKVVFEGWVDNKQVPDYVAGADICLVPHHKCSHWNHTIPNKLFDYMAAGKPVVVSDVAPMERIVSDVKCGLIFKSGNASNLAEQLSKLADQNLRKGMGKNGLKAVEEKYNWRKDATVMLNSIQKVLQ